MPISPSEYNPAVFHPACINPPSLVSSRILKPQDYDSAIHHPGFLPDSGETTASYASIDAKPYYCGKYRIGLYRESYTSRSYSEYDFRSHTEPTSLDSITEIIKDQIAPTIFQQSPEVHANVCC